MSFLETSKVHLNWIAAVPVHTSVHREAGCAQCGSRLEMSEGGKYDPSGKCFSCLHWVSDEDEDVEELEG